MAASWVVATFLLGPDDGSLARREFLIRNGDEPEPAALTA